jgi:deoxycytidylate deaminase
VKGLSLAIKAAGKARHAYFRHAALVLKGKRIVAVGSNHEGTHAEAAALVAVTYVGPFKRSYKGLDLLSIRVTRAGKLAMARPCDNCMKLIREAGIRRVYFTDADGAMRCERVR